MSYVLSDLRPGEKAVVVSLKHKGSMRRRLLDIGLVQGTTVECVGKSPAGDPAAYRIRGAIIAIRAQDGKQISVRL